MTSRFRVLVAVCLVCLAADRAAAQPSGGRRDAPFEITDNSFLVEEAFNQERGIFQNIGTWMRDEHGAWEAGFTQEWPLRSQRHQLSYTVALTAADGRTDPGSTLVHYRYQLLDEGPGRPAFSPRVSLILPTGARGTLDDRLGVQLNLPFSKQRGDFYFHWNAGTTWLPRVPSASGRTVTLNSPHVAGSVIWRTSSLFHLMLEGVALLDHTPSEVGGTARATISTLSPGFRRGWNIGERQVVAGLGLPVTRTAGETSFALLTYLSYELPF